MNIVDAVWEQRNLGVVCKEVTVTADDELEEVSAVLATLDAEYSVVKIPVNDTPLLFRLQDQGFRFIEVVTVCFHDGVDIPLNRIQQRFLEKLRYSLMDNDDLEHLFSETARGLFSTDRVALDPFFSLEQANRRYNLWIKDELERGGRMFKIEYKDEQVGFFGLKPRGERDIFAFLGGVYPDYLSSGFGFATNYYEIVEGKKSGARRITSVFSTNNRGAAAIHMSMGYTLLEQQYVLVRHFS